MLSDSKKILENNIKDIVHEDTQRHEKTVDLTLNKVMKIKNRGSLDFGGSEYQPSDTEEIPPKKKTEDDKYGWWRLDEGIYLVEYNEKINRGNVWIQPHSRLIKTGAYTPGRIIEEEGKITGLLIVGDNGVDIKENARIATAYSFE
ncbi:MAG: dCTP deaminase [Candidatus Thermoplasmatota archaeon]